MEELEENSGIKLLLAIKGLGLFTIGAMIIALGAAYKNRGQQRVTAR